MNKLDKKIQSFFALHDKLELSKGELLLRPAEEPKGIYYIVEGLIRQYDIASSGSEVVVNVFKPGAHFPMAWAINRDSNQWYFEALSNTVLYTAPAEEALAFMKSNPDVMYAYLERLCSGAAGQQRRMAHLMGGSAHNRVVFELIVECRRFGKKEGKRTTLEISEADLASRAGLSREAVSRELSELKRANLIERRYRRIDILNLVSLENHLGMEV